MRVVVKDIRIPVTVRDYKGEIKRRLLKLLSGVKIKDFEIKRRSIDARDKKKMVYWVFSVVADVEGKVNFDGKVYPYNEFFLPFKKPTKDVFPVIVGAGPSGLFSALLFTYCGIKGVIVERGCKVEDRVVKVEKLWNEGILDEDCNCQFGEGGAGTFSDGKLTTRIKDDFVGFVLREFVKFGAPENILFDSKPHIGTDYVRLVVRNIREFLLKSGWEIYYGTKVKDIEVNSGRIKAVLAENLRIEGTHFIFSIGNSARDTFNMLIKRGIAMTSKPFAIGFRIEHPQAFIDRNQYGKFHIYLPPASYNLSHHFKEANRGVYTFCMCPGGYIICVSSESGSVVTNGMSYYKRDSGYANSAIVVTVDKRDYGSDPLGGVEFQRGIERLAFKMSGGYYAISQKAIDFVKSKETRGDLKTTYRPATVTGDLSRLFKEDLVAFLRKGLVEFDRRIKGFVEKGILVGPETRTSSPIRILRDEKRLHSVSCENLFPVGEGSGYAGGIMSSVIDGFKAVISILGVGE